MQRTKNALTKIASALNTVTPIAYKLVTSIPIFNNRYNPPIETLANVGANNALSFDTLSVLSMTSCRPP